MGREGAKRPTESNANKHADGEREKRRERGEFFNRKSKKEEMDTLTRSKGDRRERGVENSVTVANQARTVAKLVKKDAEHCYA